MKFIVVIGCLITLALSNKRLLQQSGGTASGSSTYCGVNERFNQCGTACPATCGDTGPVYCTRQCVPGCFCKYGYILDEANGQCIPEDECPTEEPMPSTTEVDMGCGDNEVYRQCGSACPAKCNDDPFRFCTLQCVAGCFCKYGYVLDGENGTCIPEDECPTEEPVPSTTDPNGCDENEFYTTCGTACPASCDGLAAPFRSCTLQCVEGCFCEPGYVLDADGSCILVEECPTEEPVIMTTEACGENEVYTMCGSACPAKCGDSPFSLCTLQCVEGCFCKPGYILDSEDGECIPRDSCPTEVPVTEEPATTTVDPCGENEFYTDCGTACPAKCGDTGFSICTLQCVPGCFCKPGYILDTEDGDCIPILECPTEEPIIETTEVCGENEVYTNCGSACPAKCNDNPFRFCTLQCVPGCFCQPGYVLSEEDGDCIPFDECPTEEPVIETTEVCGDNEVFTDCGTACPAMCGDTGPKLCTRQCVRGCFCAPGYILDEEDGECIPEDECPTEEPVATDSCDENEFYTICGTACPAKCGDTGFSICTLQCVEGCFCKPGFILDEEDGECIPIDECGTDEPVTTEACDENEVYTNCGTACPAKCGDTGFSICTLQCVPGCFCKPGYILDGEDGDCIPRDECPMGSTEEPMSTEETSCGDNEEFNRCGTACPAKCGDIGPLPCTRQCVPGCFCKDGFILDEEDGDCIPEDQCPLITTETPLNETEIEVTDPINPSDANMYGSIMVFVTIMAVFGWM